MEGEKKRGRVPAGGRGGGPGRQPAAATAASACGLLRETRPPARGQSGRPGAVSFALYPQAHEGKRVDDSPAAIMVSFGLFTSDNLTVNYGVKQSQFTKPTSEPRSSDSEESNETFDHAIR